MTFLRRHPKAAATVTFFVVVVIAVVILGSLYRSAYGAWFPSPPDQIRLCGRQYNRAHDKGYGSIPAGERARKIGKKPAVIGWDFFESRRGMKAPAKCLSPALFRKTSGGRFEPYVLAGGPPE